MSDREINGILSEARAALEPTVEDRRRVHKKVLAAIGTAGAVATVAASTANASGSGAGGVGGVVASKATLIKLGVATLLVGGAIGIVTMMTSESADPLAAHGSPDRNEHPRVTLPNDVASPEPVSVPLPDAEPEVSRTPVVLSSEGLEHEDESKIEEARRNVERMNNPHRTTRKQSDEVYAKNDTMLFKELSLIRKASSALRQDRPGDAMRFLEEYDREIKKGVMREEREGLQVLILCAQGRTVEARKARARFLRRSPRSPLAARIKERCSETENP